MSALTRALLEGHRGDGLTAARDDRVRLRAVVAKGHLDQPIAIKDGDADMVAVGPAFGCIWPSIPTGRL